MVAPTQTTRRNLLRIGTTAAAYAAGAAIVTGGAALASQAKGATPTGLSPGFAQALAAFAAAQRNASSHEALIVGPTRARWLAAKDAVPHATIAPGSSWRGSHVFWSTDNYQALSIAKGIVADHPRTSRTHDVIRARKLVAADHRRARAIARVGRTTGIHAAIDESDRLGDLLVAAEDAVCAFPATTLGDLEAKLAFFVERDLAQNDGNVELALADVRRLLSQEGR